MHNKYLARWTKAVQADEAYKNIRCALYSTDRSNYNESSSNSSIQVMRKASVSGFGGLKTYYNGDYTLAYVYNGKPLYKKADIELYYESVSGQWRFWLLDNVYFYITSTAATPPDGTYTNIQDSNESYSITITLSDSESISTNFTNDSIHKDYYIIKGGNDLDEKIPLIVTGTVDTNQFEGIFKLCNQGSLFTDSMLQDPYCLLLQALIIDSNFYHNLEILVDGVTKITLTADGKIRQLLKYLTVLNLKLTENMKHFYYIKLCYLQESQLSIYMLQMDYIHIISMLQLLKILLKYKPVI